MTSTSKSGTQSRDGSGRDCPHESSSFPTGIGLMKTVMTKGGRVRERLLGRKGSARVERVQRNLDHEPKFPVLSECRKRRAVTHEEEKGNILRSPSVRSRPAVSQFARESRGLG